MLWRADRIWCASPLLRGLLLGSVGSSFEATAGAHAAVSLPAVTVYSSRVANQAPVAAFAMPVSVLRYEPKVDIQGRNLAEGQSDITIRGGIFENTGIQIGILSLGDPQTGHYHAEVPIAPAMLGAARVVTGPDVALAAVNTTVGALAYVWRPILGAGAASIGGGENRLRRAEFYHGQRSTTTLAGRQVGVDLALAHSRSDGAVRFGDHEFGRFSVRGQLRGRGAQTDLVLGYQGKRFGWPNLYTPFGSNELENLQTRLALLNHRQDGVDGDFLEWGVFERRNKDDYAFNRFAPVGPVHPFQHTTWVRGVAAQSRQSSDAYSLDLRAEINSDRLESTSLNSGRFRARTLTKLAAIGGRIWPVAGGAEYRIRTGFVHDDTNRDSASVSPVFEVARTFQHQTLSRVHVSFNRASQVPTYTALNSSPTSGLFRGNPELGRSRSDNIELGLTAGALGWSVQSAFFVRRDRRLVDWTFRRGTTARTANAMNVEVIGLEFLGRRHWAVGEMTIGYTALGKSEDYLGAPVDASFYALNYARHRLTAALTLRPGAGWEIRIDNCARVQAENVLRFVGGRHAIHTMLGVSWRPPRWERIEISASVENLWDDEFQEIPAVPATPRQFSVALGTTW